MLTTVLTFAALAAVWVGLRIWQAKQVVAAALADLDHTPAALRELDEEGQP